MYSTENFIIVIEHYFIITLEKLQKIEPDKTYNIISGETREITYQPKGNWSYYDRYLSFIAVDSTQQNNSCIQNKNCIRFKFVSLSIPEGYGCAR